MIGFCNKLNMTIISEADCYKCKYVDLTCCRYWRESNERHQRKTKEYWISFHKTYVDEVISLEEFLEDMLNEGFYEA